MSEPARLRLFCALRLARASVELVAAWQERELRAARLVPRENLHLTLAFLGSTPREELGAVGGALARAAGAAGAISLTLRSYRETRSVGMLVFDDDHGRAGALQAELAGSLEQLGLYRREARPWMPHLTVIRFASPPRLQPPLPALGRLSPSDAAVYSSTLRPEGARYEVLEASGLGG